MHGRTKRVVLTALCLFIFLSIEGAAPEKTLDTRPLEAVPTPRSSSIALTVIVVSGGVKVRLFDELGTLVQSTPPLTPPAVANLRMPEGPTIDLGMPGGVFADSAIVDVYVKGRPLVRPLIEEADKKAAQHSSIPFGNMDALEFTATAEPKAIVIISISCPLGSNPAILNSLKAYYLLKNKVMWVPFVSSTFDPEKTTVTFELKHSAIVRLMTGSSHDLREVIVYPNPFRPRSAKDNVLKFIGLSDNVNITLFTLSGDVVWARHFGLTGGGITWDGRNLDGREVASGLYVYEITNTDGEKVTGRISVIW